MTFDSIPNELNGYRVIAKTAHDNCATVMMHDNAGSRFIVATWWPELKNSWSWGHYHHYSADDIGSRNDARDDADASYEDAKARNRKR